MRRAFVLALAFAAATAACSATDGADPPSGGSRGIEVRFDENGRIVERRALSPVTITETRPGFGGYAIGFASGGDGKLATAVARPKISPALRAMAAAAGDAPLEVLVVVRGSTLAPAEGTVRSTALDRLRLVRLADQASTTARLASVAGAVIGRYPIGNVLHATLPGRALGALEADGAVLSISPRKTHLPPPASDCGPTPPIGSAYQPRDLGALTGLTAYEDAGDDGRDWWIGQIDTGVIASHSVTPRVFGRFDCVNGGAHCDDENSPGYDAYRDVFDHGTAVAHLLAGGSDDDARRGLTRARIHNYVVYDDDGLDVLAAVRAINESVLRGDVMVVVEAQDNDPSQVLSPLSVAADDAWAWGVAVVAASGNVSQMQTAEVGNPATGKKVIAVSDAYFRGMQVATDAGHGPTSDDRWKPDAIALDGAETASRECSTCFHYGFRGGFCGTSAAAPMAAATLIDLRSFLVRQGLDTIGSDPLVHAPWDKTFAAYFALGSEVGNFVEARLGVGLVTLPKARCARVRVGTAAVREHEWVTLATLGEDESLADEDVRAAIWWPEEATAHADVDLFANDASGATLVKSTTWGSVFERVHLAGRFPDRGTLRAYGYHVEVEEQPIAWAIFSDVPCR